MQQSVSIDSNHLVHTWPGRRVRQMRAEEQEERKINVKACKEQCLCPLGPITWLFALESTGSTIIHFRRRACCDDSPGVKCPIESTAQCVYFLCLSIRALLLILLSMCLPASPPSSCRCSWNFNLSFIRPSRNLSALTYLNKTNWSWRVTDIVICYGRYGRCKHYCSVKESCLICYWNVSISSWIDPRQ